MSRAARWLVWALVLGGAGSCSSSTGPVAGILTVSLTTPNTGADGAALLTVTGPTGLTSVTAAAGLRVFSQTLSTTTRLVVTGPLPNGPILTIGVTDVSQVSQYGATLQDVAGTDFQLHSLAGYSLTVAK